MVAPGMRRYRVRTTSHATLVGPTGDEVIDPLALFPDQTGPLRLEIGCGHGEFISQMAAAHPSERFLGLEVDPLRVTKIAHKCLKLGATNVRLFQGEAHRFVHVRLPTASVARIYILFPDPWPKPGHRRRRLMNRHFLHDLSRIAAPGCRLEIASDTHNYAFQALSNLTTLHGLWHNRFPSGYAIDIPTRFPTVFERYKKSEGCTIAYLRLERSATPAPPVPDLLEFGRALAPRPLPTPAHLT